MSEQPHPDHACGWPSCEIDWLFRPDALSDPAVIARIRAEWDGAKTAHRWKAISVWKRKRTLQEAS